MTDSLSQDGKEAYTSLILSYLDDSLFTESSATNVEIENTSDSDPLKPIASDMVRLISDLRATLPSSQQEGERTRGASRTAVSAQTSLGASTPSKRSVLSKAFNRTPAPSPSSHAVRDENRIRAWHSLLDFCITTITGAVGIDILGENVPDGDRYSLALMSFLQRGQWVLQRLFKEVTGDRGPSLYECDGSSLLQWAQDAKRELKNCVCGIKEKNLSKKPTEATEPGPSEGIVDHICPLLRVIPISISQRATAKPPSCTASEYFAAVLYISPRDEKFVGVLREVSLFRSNKAPLHHEFLIVGFGKDGEDPTSWMRTERAAQTQRGTSGPAAALDSSRPLLGGAEARESFSFSTSRLGLCTNARELARITLMSPTKPPFLINDFNSQILWTSDSNSKYRLFTTNCRWYSRRLLLNVMQWCDDVKPLLTASWKGSDSSLKDIRANLEKETFGGSKLADAQARGLDHQNRIMLTMAHLTSGSQSLSRAELDDIKDSVLKAPLDEKQRANIVPDMLITRARLLMAEDLPQALDDAQHALQLVMDRPQDSSDRKYQLFGCLNGLADALGRGCRPNEADSLRREALGLFQCDNPLYLMCLIKIGEEFRRVKQHEEVIRTFKHALEVVGCLAQPGTWLGSRTYKLMIHIPLAEALENLHRYKEAIPLRQEIVTFYRDDLYSEGRVQLLLSTLLQLAECAFSAKDHGIAKSAAAEAVPRCKTDCKYEIPLLKFLMVRAQSSHALGQVPLAIRVITEAIDMQPRADPDDIYGLRGIFLRLRASWLYEKGSNQQALEDMEQAIPSYTSSLLHDPDNATIASHLRELHFWRGSIFEKQGLAGRALSSYRNAADGWRGVVQTALEDKDYEVKLLEFCRALEGCVRMLQLLNRIQEAKSCGEERISRLRPWHQCHPGSLLVTKFLRWALMDQYQMVTKLGDDEGGLRLISEAVEVGKLLEPDEPQSCALFFKMNLEVRLKQGNERRVGQMK